MLTLGQAIAVLAVGAWAFGPKELPRVARAAGRLAGRATGALYSARAQFLQFAGEAEMNKVHAEVQAVLGQLRAIQAELQGGLSLAQPGTLAPRLLQSELGLPKAAAAAAPSRGGPRQPSAPAGPPPQRQPPLPLAAGAVASEAASPSSAAAVQSGAWQGASESSSGGAARGGAPPVPGPIPVSAVAAGLIPDRTGTELTLADIALDAIWEERVAQQAQRFFQQAVQSQLQLQRAAALEPEAAPEGQPPQPPPAAAAQQPGPAAAAALDHGAPAQQAPAPKRRRGRRRSDPAADA